MGSPLRSRQLPLVIVAAFSVVFAGRVLWLMWVQSPIVDEIVHIPAAYGHWRYGDASLNPEHPPVAKLLSAAGLFALGGRIDCAPGPGLYRRFFEQDWRRRTFAARLPMLAFSLGVILVLAALLSWLFDPLTAALATAALTLYTVFIAHAVFVHTDVPASFFYLAACALVLRARSSEGGAARLIALGIVIALGFLTKFSLVLGLPAAVLALAPGRPGRRWLVDSASLVALSLIALVLLSALAYAPPVFTAQETRDPAGAWLPLPRLLLVGWWWQVDHNRTGHDSILFMHASSEGWRSYFPLAYLLKTPLSILITTFVGGAVLARRRPPWFLGWLVFVAVYWVAAITSPIDIGVRLLLPVLVVMWVGLAAGVRFWLSRPWRRALGALLFLELIASSALHWNGELAAFGELTLGRPGWRFLADSNVDWGQQAAPVARFAARHGLRPLYADVMNPLSLSLFGAEAQPLADGLTGQRLRPGYYAVSAHQLAAQPNAPYSCFRGLRPLRSFGDSSFLYRIERGDADTRRCPR